MGLRRVDRIMPSWVQSLGAILDQERVTIYALCSRCGEQRQVDVAALAEKVGREYSLIGRRTRHRGCGGWFRFKYSTGTWSWRMWSDADESRWLARELVDR